MNQVKLIAVGDISLQVRDKKDPFEKIKEILRRKDILFGNLETVLSNANSKTEKAVLLKSSPGRVKFLKDAGFDVLNLVNNHTMDLGIEGLEETIKTLGKTGIDFLGIDSQLKQNYVIIERQGVRFGFLGYARSIWINKTEEEGIKKDVEFLKKQCDFIIISLHWGVENVFYPSPAQIDLAHNLIDAGAVLILGHHPHVIQGIERYKHGLIAYSLGNFQFDPEISYSKTNHSLIICVEFGERRLKNYGIIPITIDQNFSPTLLHNEVSKKTINFVNRISEPIVDGTLTESRWFEEIAGEYLGSNMRSWVIRVKRYGIKHFFQCVKWLVSPFVIRCYLGFLMRIIKRKKITQM